MLPRTVLLTLLALLPARDRPPASAATGTVAAIPDSVLADYARRTWQLVGRQRVARWGGLRYARADGAWQVDSAWRSHEDAGAGAYYVEPVVHGVLELARGTGDRVLLDEVARIYVAYLGRFVPASTILARSATAARRSTALPEGDPASRVLPWLDRTRAIAVPAECVLCSAQVMHPAARLVRMIAGMPDADRTGAMRTFVGQYVPLLSREHLRRLVYDTQWPATRGRRGRLTRFQHWQDLAAGKRIAGPAHLSCLHDTDLWLMAAAAELLEAHRLDPALVPLGADSAPLAQLVRAGVGALERSATPHPGTRDFAGRVVGSLGFFEGDYDAHPEMAFAGDTSPTLPAPGAGRPPVRGSWDIAHVQRLPIALRSLWDARRATGPAFPDESTLRLSVNQLLYRVFDGDYRELRFRNFLDGGDGWFRGGYKGRAGWGYPPSASCDNRDTQRPCQTPEGVAGWGVLLFANDGLAPLRDALYQLAADTSAAGRAVRERRYAVPNDPFSLAPGDSARPSPNLARLIGEFLGGRVP
ncbi:MAG: hypothetical protein IPL76_00315 [Gemmatimonadetes bacterium]|nr:hypothetical protein [Gemmatimonadota bacterium]